MVRMLDAVGRDAHVAVLHRFAIMSHWRQMQHIPFEHFTSRDGLHVNDGSYDCVSKLLAASIVEQANLPVAGRSLASGERS